MRIQGLFTAAKLLALLAVVVAGIAHIAGGESALLYNKLGDYKRIQNFNGR
jgi:type IV secretory pathway VirB2 component (pilin)